MDKKDYELSAKITRLANRGVRKAIDAAHRAGLAVPYALGNKILYQLPDGSITDKQPKVIKKK
ncbi:MAG: hypothetical protein LBB23_03250 [Rickettsiales bacterium]|jgi:hypothetical protein|nr:hypothetical protein [Rickettsiales bacterium]